MLCYNKTGSWFMSWHSYLVKTLTLGVINYETGNLIIKDPITGTGNGLKQIKDALFNDFNEGVWIGKRTLEESWGGFSTYLLENYNLNYLHYVIRVDGKNWHLCSVNGSRKKGKNFSGGDTILYVGRCDEPDQKFQWFYKGKAKNNINQAIRLINNSAKQYDVILTNCQDVVKALYWFVRGGCLDDVIFFLFPKQIGHKILKAVPGIAPVVKLAFEIANMVLP